MEFQRGIFTGRVPRLVRSSARARPVLQIAYERLEHLAPEEGEMAHFLDFIDADVVDLFRVVASDAADLVPGLEAWEECADPGGWTET
jgi:hypothetical protein